eukprot:11221352-Prorocentrum_lima.AAC.1
MTSSLVGSEMCIRDRARCIICCSGPGCWRRVAGTPCLGRAGHVPRRTRTVSYTHLTLPTICSV